jgi:dTDP-4-dehydrorhamnose reductase
MRILVTGAGGCLGRAVCARAAALGIDAIGLTRAACDVTETVATDRAIATWAPDAVVFCAAATDLDALEAGGGWEVNAQAPGRWARRVPTWFVSTNYVFHEDGPHDVDARVDPRSAYARQKRAGEEAVLAAGGHVARVGWLVGDGGRTFGATVGGRLRRGERVRAVSDVVVHPSRSGDVAEALLTFPEGISHHLGRDPCTWYTFALALRARLGSGEVDPVRQADLGLTATRPRDARLTPAALPGWRSWLG